MTVLPGDGATAAAVAAEFGLGEPLGPLTVAAAGKQGVVHELVTDQGRFAVKLLLMPLTEEAAGQDVRLLEVALARGIHAPAPVRTRRGTLLTRVGERRGPGGPGGALVRVFGWVDLHPPRLDLDPAALGDLLGRLHRDPLPPPPEQPAAPGGPPVDPWYTEPVPEHELLRLADALTRAGAPFAAEYAATVPQLVARHTDFGPPDRLQLCHRDLWADNLRGTPDGRLCAIDWDNCGPADPAGEVAMLLAEFCHADPDRAAALAAAYTAAGGTALPRRRTDFTMVLAQFGHFAQEAAQRWLAVPGTGPEAEAERAENEAWFRELLDRPLDGDQIDLLLTAVNQG